MCKLKKKYKPNTAQTLIRLKREFSGSRQQSWRNDLDLWISKLEVTRKRLKEMNHIITEDNMLIHILNNLPNDYINIV